MVTISTIAYNHIYTQKSTSSCHTLSFTIDHSTQSSLMDRSPFFFCVTLLLLTLWCLNLCSQLPDPLPRQPLHFMLHFSVALTKHSMTLVKNNNCSSNRGGSNTSKNNSNGDGDSSNNYCGSSHKNSHCSSSYSSNGSSNDSGSSGSSSNSSNCTLSSLSVFLPLSISLYIHMFHVPLHFCPFLFISFSPSLFYFFYYPLSSFISLLPFTTSVFTSFFDFILILLVLLCVCVCILLSAIFAMALR